MLCWALQPNVARPNLRRVPAQRFVTKQGAASSAPTLIGNPLGLSIFSIINFTSIKPNKIILGE